MAPAPTRPIRALTPDEIARFTSKVVIAPNGCWEWSRSCFKNGYGRFQLDGHSLLAHRVAYAIEHGGCPTDVDLDHKECRNRRCVRVDHLVPSTARENLLSSPFTEASKNAAKTHCKHNHPLDGENLYIKPNGCRGCHTCRRLAARRHYERKVAAL